MPRPCDCDTVTGPTYDPTQCRLCWLYAHDPRYRRKWGGAAATAAPPVRRSSTVAVGGASFRVGQRPPAPAARRKTPLATLPPCRWEGPVVEWCKTCGGEARHVRLCLHDDGPDKCVRGPSRNPDVRSCGQCPLREVPSDG